LSASFAQYVTHCNEQRPHRGIDLEVPAGGVAPFSILRRDIRRREVLGGLIHEYYPVAA
jgi:hypothetical protein